MKVAYNKSLQGHIILKNKTTIVHVISHCFYGTCKNRVKQCCYLLCKCNSADFAIVEAALAK